jgi:ribosomal protein L7Ae-like RNA K-turn-binding protein
VSDQAKRKALGLLGLGLRGRLVVVGVDQARAAVQRGKAAFALVAPDASKNSLDKIVPMLRARRVPASEVFGAAELGSAVGRVTTAVVVITDRQLANGIRKLVESSPDRAHLEGMV